MTVSGLGGGREFLRGSVLSLDRAVTTPGPQGQQPREAGPRPAASAFTRALDVGRLVRILVKFLGDDFFCSLYFLK